MPNFPEWVNTISWAGVLSGINILLITAGGLWIKRTGNWGQKRQERTDIEASLNSIISEYREARTWAEKKAGSEEKKRKDAEAEATGVIRGLQNELGELKKSQKILEGEVVVLTKKVESYAMTHTALQQEYDKATLRITEKRIRIDQLEADITKLKVAAQADHLNILGLQRQLAKSAILPPQELLAPSARETEETK